MLNSFFDFAKICVRNSVVVLNRMVFLNHVILVCLGLYKYPHHHHHHHVRHEIDENLPDLMITQLIITHSLIMIQVL